MSACFGSVTLVVLLSPVLLALPPSALAAPPDTPEWTLVAREACGSEALAQCLDELRKVCHEHATFRCYYSRKARFDALHRAGLPDPRPHDRDEE